MQLSSFSLSIRVQSFFFFFLILPNLKPRWCFVAVISRSWQWDAHFISSVFWVWGFVWVFWPLLSLNKLLSLYEGIKWETSCQSGSSSLFSLPITRKSLQIPGSFLYPLVPLACGFFLIPFKNSRSCSKWFPPAYWYSGDTTFWELFFLLLHTA